MDKKSIFGVGVGIIVLCVVLFSIFFVEKIPRGYVGAIYSIDGGTEDYVLSEGWHVLSPTKKITEYSIATEQLFMSRDEREGSEDNESFDAMCSDGVLNVDVEMSYSFDPDNIPAISKRYRGMSGEDIVSKIVKAKVKTYTNEVTSNFTIMEAYMDKRTEINNELTTYLSSKLSPYGIIVESATIPRSDPGEKIKKTIIERSKVSQEVEIEKERQKKATLEAETKVIVAKGNAESAIEKAKGQAEANRLTTVSLTPEIIQNNWIQKWDGKLSTVTSDSNMPIVNLK